MSSSSLSSTAPLNIGLITCSTRNPRAGPQIAAFVQAAISRGHPCHSGSASTQPYTLTQIDLADWPLPLFDEPGVPSHTAPSAYVHAHTRAWSAHIAGFDGFVFVTPQYNWGYPASVKNAIDYLFSEWAGKGALVVSYGGHGGGKANAQLREVLSGVRMRVVGKGVALAFEGREALRRAVGGEDLGLLLKTEEGGSGAGVWKGEAEEIATAFGELLGLAGEGKQQREAMGKKEA